MAGIVHVKKRLEAISRRFPVEQDYCSGDFLPRIPVSFLSDFVVRHSKPSILRLDELAMNAPDDELPPEVELVLQADEQYLIKFFAVRSPDKMITKRNADPSIDYETERTLLIRQRMDIRLEYLRIKQVLRNPALMTNQSTLLPAQKWDVPGSPQNTPVTTGRNIVTQIKLLNGGNLPNKIRFTTPVKNAIVATEEFKDYVKFNVLDKSRPIGDEELIAAVWGLPSGVVKTSDATYNKANVNATPVYKTFLGADTVFAYVTAPGIRTYGLGERYTFSGYSSDPYTIIAVPQYQRGIFPGEDLRGIAGEDPHIGNPDSGYLLQGCITPGGTFDTGNFTD
jgi:hypothetical protein